MATEEKVRKALTKVMNDAVSNYLAGINGAVYALVTLTENGGIILVQWPNDNAIYVNWTSNAAGFGDLGTMVGSVSTEYFGVESLVFLLSSIVDSYCAE